MIAFPVWQVLLVLVGLPTLYTVNSLLPWSNGLFRQHDHHYFLQFWASIAVLHWASVALVIGFLKRTGGRLVDIGLNLSAFNVAAIVGVPLAVGLALTALQEASGTKPPSVGSSAVLPVTTGERLFWIFMSLTAGFCEELIYRGFGIRALQRNMRTWLAVGVATLAFFFMHGMSALAPSPFLIIYTMGLVFSVLFLWRGSLVPVICLHALIDVANIGSF